MNYRFNPENSQSKRDRYREKFTRENVFELTVITKTEKF